VGEKESGGEKGHRDGEYSSPSLHLNRKQKNGKEEDKKKGVRSRKELLLYKTAKYNTWKLCIYI
jgi:hypothetical protein